MPTPADDRLTKNRSPRLTIGYSERGRDYWATRPYITPDIRDSVATADIVLLPQEGFRDHDGPLFPVGTESIVAFVRSGLPSDLRFDVCVADEHYTELALHGLVLQLGVWLASFIGAPVLVTVLAEYIKERRRAAPDESTVRIKLLLDNNERVISIEYEGPSDAFEENVGRALTNYALAAPPNPPTPSDSKSSEPDDSGSSP